MSVISALGFFRLVKALRKGRNYFTPTQGDGNAGSPHGDPSACFSREVSPAGEQPWRGLHLSAGEIRKVL